MAGTERKFSLITNEEPEGEECVTYNGDRNNYPPEIVEKAMKFFSDKGTPLDEPKDLLLGFVSGSGRFLRRCVVTAQFPFKNKGYRVQSILFEKEKNSQKEWSEWTIVKETEMEGADAFGKTFGLNFVWKDI